MSALHRLQAYGGLFNRYREVFAHFWRLRHALDRPAVRGYEAEFLPGAMALQAQPVSPVGRLVAYVLMALVAAALVWSVVGQVDIVVNATGKVIPSARTKTIASVEVASVRAIHVREGQTVSAGAMLVELDATATEAEHDKAWGARTAAILQIARAKAMLAGIESGREPTLPWTREVPVADWQAEKQHLLGQYRDLVARLNRADGDIARFGEALELAAKEAADYKVLAQDHDVAPHAYLQREQARVDLEGQLWDARNQRESLLAEAIKLAYDAIAEGEKQLGDSEQDARRAVAHNRQLALTAPVDGTVQQLSVHTIGGVVPAAQPLMEIVPRDSAVEIEATLENRDIGFVREGQPVVVKVDAFDYTRYGTVPGTVSHVSRDALQDEKRGLLYAAIITLNRSSLAVDGGAASLTPGMTVDVEIKTGTRRVIDYVLSPLIQHRRESLHER